MKQAVVTTVIPTFRRPHLLKRAIASALNQTYEAVAVEVFDNASGDETAAVVAEAASKDPRVRYFCHPCNIGSIRNFEFGMRQVRTPYFSFLSDDDLLLPRFYEEAIGALERNPSAMLFAAPAIHVNLDGGVIGLALDKWQAGVHRPPAALYAILRGEMPFWTSLVFRREILSTVGLLDVDVGEAADLDFLIRAAARHSIVVSKQPGAIYVLHPQSATEQLKLSVLWNGRLNIMRNMRNGALFPNEYQTEALRLFERLCQKHVFFHAQKSAMKGSRTEALKGADLLEGYFGSKNQANRIRLLVQLDRLGLGSLMRFGAAATRSIRHPYGFFHTMRKRAKYQKLLNKTFEDFRSAVSAAC